MQIEREDQPPEDRAITFGRGACCWKPQGCTMTEAQGCRLMRHPVKRATLLNDPEAPCPKGWSIDDEPQTCALLNSHEGECVPCADAR